LTAAETAHLVGQWNATTVTTGTKLASSPYSLAGIATGLGAIAWLLRARDPHDATPLALVAGLFLFVAGGLADITTLTNSQLPTTLAPTLARVGIAISLGLGAGVMVGAAFHIRRPVASAPV
jgi:hypothetical protein